MAATNKPQPDYFARSTNEPQNDEFEIFSQLLFLRDGLLELDRPLGDVPRAIPRKNSVKSRIKNKRNISKDLKISPNITEQLRRLSS